MERSRLVFAGAGGQGVITAAIILGEAVVLYEGLNAVQSQSYGAAARGGITRSDLIVADSEINFPLVNQPNVLVCLSQPAYNAYYSIIRPGGLMIIDSYLVNPQQEAEARIAKLDMYQTIRRELGETVVLNICMLGALQALTQLVRQESLLRVMAQKLSQSKLEMNKKAFEFGRQLARAS